jgi:hypothetical protein
VNPFASSRQACSVEMLAQKQEKEGAELLSDNRAMEAALNLKSSRQEPSGVGRAGCCESRRWNRRGLTQSVAHRHRNEWYKRKWKACKAQEEGYGRAG